MPLPAGKLTHRILFERKPGGRDAAGHKSDAWQPLFSRLTWPNFGTGQERRAAAAEKTEAGQTAAGQAATFRVRICSQTKTLTPGDRLRCDPMRQRPTDLEAAPLWDIKSVSPFERDAIDVAAVRIVKV